MQVESYHVINMSRLTQNKYLAGTGVMLDEKNDRNTFLFLLPDSVPLENEPTSHSLWFPQGSEWYLELT